MHWMVHSSDGVPKSLQSMTTSDKTHMPAKCLLTEALMLLCRQTEMLPMMSFSLIKRLIMCLLCAKDCLMTRNKQPCK